MVTSISPDRIGYGGGTININGDGFATDGFSQFDPDKGNKVCTGCTRFYKSLCISVGYSCQ